MNSVLLIALLMIPIGFGIALACLKNAAKRTADTVFLIALVLETCACIGYLLLPDANVLLFSMTDRLSVAFRTDAVSRVFLSVGVFGFLFSGVYAVRYMAHGSRQHSFYAFLLFSLPRRLPARFD